VPEALERSERELRAARVLLEQGLYDEVFPLAYQAAEDAARTALEANGLESAKTHAATISRFGELLMSKGGDVEAGRALNRLARRRQRIVYDWLPAGADDARDAVAWAEQVVAAARSLIPAR
jgi:uncharacterized protein (UPF0332 family)